MIDADGTIAEWAMKIVREFNTYTERTPSGTGLRVLIWGDKPGRRCKTSKRPGLEIYESDRYLTVTGRHLEGTPTAIARRQQELEALYFETFPEDKPKANTAAGDCHPIATDDEIVDKARKASNGDKFAALFDRGDTGGYAGDISAADLALANMLAFWTGRDFNRIETLFSSSALGQRDKWKLRADYRQRTIDHAIDGCSDVYSGNGKRPAQKRTSASVSHRAGDVEQRDRSPGRGEAAGNSGHHGRASGHRPGR